MLNSDFRDILSEFNAAGVEYLVVGAYALAAHGLPRATGDIDLWVRPSPDNAERVWLARFGAALDRVSRADLTSPDVVLQIGVPPARVDVLTSVDGVEFDRAWAARLSVRIDDIDVTVIGRSELLENKRAAGRPQDLADVARLERLPGGGTRLPER